MKPVFFFLGKRVSSFPSLIENLFWTEEKAPDAALEK
jgi:hypothetical protein